MNPLVIRIVVSAENVQILRTSAEFGTEPAGDHVPRLKLRLPVAFRSGRLVGIIRIDSNVNDRLGMEKARARVDFTNSLRRSDRGVHELGLEFGTALFGE